MLPALDADTGRLPLGRFGATLEDVKRDFVDATRYADSETRSQIWQDFESATQGIRSVLPVVFHASRYRPYCPTSASTYAPPTTTPRITPGQKYESKTLPSIHSSGMPSPPPSVRPAMPTSAETRLNHATAAGATRRKREGEDGCTALTLSP